MKSISSPDPLPPKRLRRRLGLALTSDASEASAGPASLLSRELSPPLAA